MALSASQPQPPLPRGVVDSPTQSMFLDVHIYYLHDPRMAPAVCHSRGAFDAVGFGVSVGLDDEDEDAGELDDDRSDAEDSILQEMWLAGPSLFVHDDVLCLPCSGAMTVKQLKDAVYDHADYWPIHSADTDLLLYYEQRLLHDHQLLGSTAWFRKAIERMETLKRNGGMLGPCGIWLLAVPIDSCACPHCSSYQSKRSQRRVKLAHRHIEDHYQGEFMLVYQQQNQSQHGAAARIEEDDSWMDDNAASTNTNRQSKQKKKKKKAKNRAAAAPSPSDTSQKQRSTAATSKAITSSKPASPRSDASVPTSPASPPHAVQPQPVALTPMPTPMHCSIRHADSPSTSSQSAALSHPTPPPSSPQEIGEFTMVLSKKERKAKAKLEEEHAASMVHELSSQMATASKAKQNFKSAVTQARVASKLIASPKLAASTLPTKQSPRIVSMRDSTLKCTTPQLLPKQSDSKLKPSRSSTPTSALSPQAPSKSSALQSRRNSQLFEQAISPASLALAPEPSPAMTAVGDSPVRTGEARAAHMHSVWSKHDTGMESDNERTMPNSAFSPASSTASGHSSVDSQGFSLFSLGSRWSPLASSMAPPSSHSAPTTTSITSPLAWQQSPSAANSPVIGVASLSPFIGGQRGSLASIPSTPLSSAAIEPPAAAWTHDRQSHTPLLNNDRGFGLPSDEDSDDGWSAMSAADVSKLCDEDDGSDQRRHPPHSGHLGKSVDDHGVTHIHHHHYFYSPPQQPMAMAPPYYQQPPYAEHLPHAHLTPHGYYPTSHPLHHPPMRPVGDYLPSAVYR